MDTVKSLIINSPYEKPTRHWKQRSDQTLELVDERRPAGYEIFDPHTKRHWSEEITLVNKIRKRVDSWRADGYPGITSLTRRLLEHWHDRSERQYPFYFCQLEAIETLIWWVEASKQYKQGIVISGDGGPWERLCNKMATGTGKTTLMALIIAWQVLNAVTYPRRREFSRAVFIVAPGLTVKERLQVLYPGNEQNYYDAFRICPSESLRQKLNQAEILIENWHTLMPLKEQKKSVVRKGPESDEAFTRRVLGKLAAYRRIIVINDEAHHAYRIPAELKTKKIKGISIEEQEEATRWIEGLDRIHKTRGILRCFDLSATPFAPTGKRNVEHALFPWIVSDFGLNDAIEAGLVKTPRVVVRDDALPDVKTYRSRLYHIYNDPDVKDDLNRKAEPHEPLPDLVQKAYTILAADWRETLKAWQESGHSVPPVILTVCNRVETAARIEHYFNQGDCYFPELHAPEKTLRVDSKILQKAEAGESVTGHKDYEERLKQIVQAASIPETRKRKLLNLKKEELLREIVDTVGKPGKAGSGLQNVISVAMLSEGWDAKNVTHILGLRAFTSQLLCEQVIGRGLRRVAYEMDEDGLFLPEYVNIFGVPLSIFQDVGQSGASPAAPKPSICIESLPERKQFEIRWPVILRIETVIKPRLEIDWDAVDVLELDPSNTPISAEIAPALGGATDLAKAVTIDLEKLPEAFRLQRVIFQAARKAFEQLNSKNFKGNRDYLVYQLINIVEEFINSDKLKIPNLYHQDPARKRILLALNIDRLVQHLVRNIRQQNRESIVPIFDPERPIGSTADMRAWYTTRPCHPTIKSQISHVVFDSTWEATEAYILEHSDVVSAYARNDHLGFHILYLFNGRVRKYVPDFLIKLKNGRMLILEVKGQDSEENKVKGEYLDVWVNAVNQHGGFGEWCRDVSYNPSDVRDILKKFCRD
jgi:type III restriction enzyme